MDLQLLQLIEQACFTIYNANNQNDRNQAQQLLEMHFQIPHDSAVSAGSAQREFLVSTHESIYRSQFVLSQTNAVYTQMFIATILKAALSYQFGMLNLDQKIELKQFILKYLHGNNQLKPFLVTNFAQIYALFIRIGWFEDDRFQSVLEDMKPFNQSMETSIVGNQILTILVSEICQPLINQKNTTKHRKVATSFRDKSLLQIFQNAFDRLEQFTKGQLQSDKNLEQYIESILHLVKACFLFDFIGTNDEDTSEDISALQVPTNWKPMITNLRIYFILFGVFQNAASSSSLSLLSLECLSLLLSCRKSIFSSDEKDQVLDWVFDATPEMLNCVHQFGDDKHRHELTKLILRFKNANQLGEMLERPKFLSWIQLVSQYSQQCFMFKEWQSQMIVYLLTFWSKVSLSLSTGSSSKIKNQDQVEDAAMHAILTFVQRRISVNDSDENSDDCLTQESDLLTILELTASVLRLKFEQSATLIIQNLDQHISQWQSIMANPSSATKANETYETLERKFIWTVYFVGSLITPKTPMQGSSDDKLDGELSWRLFQWMNWIGNFHSSSPQISSQIDFEQIDSALLYFLDTFRQVYIGDQSQRTSKLFDVLEERLCLPDAYAVLNLIIKKLIFNLIHFGNREKIINRSIRLLGDLGSGYTSVKMVRKTESSQDLLKKHQLGFLSHQGNLKSRMTYYAALIRILVATDEPLEVEFNNFLEPFEQMLQPLLSYTGGVTVCTTAEETILALMMDLRGIAVACSSKKVFSLFFDWIKPYLDGLNRFFDDINPESKCCISILRFYSEITQNRFQRLCFDIFSADGVILFKKAAQIIYIYGNKLNQIKTLPKDKWAYPYKGLSICLNIMNFVLNGKYVHFGIMEFYNDHTLQQTFDLVFALIESIDLSQTLVYTKLSKSWFRFMEIFSGDHLMTHRTLTSQQFSHFVKSLGEGITGNDANIVSHACIAVDHLTSFLFQKNALQKRNHSLFHFCQQQPQLLCFLLNRFLEVTLFEDSLTQWSLTRALLPLILLQQDYYQYYINTLVSNQPAEKKDTIRELLSSITENVQDNLSPKNRDLFTQQVLNFKRDLRSQLLTLYLPPTLQFSSLSNLSMNK